MMIPIAGMIAWSNNLSYIIHDKELDLLTIHRRSCPNPVFHNESRSNPISPVVGLSARNEDIVIPRLELAPAHIITSRVEAENAVKRRDVTAESAAKILTDVDALAVMKVASEPVDCESAQAYIDVAERNKAVVRARSHVEMLIHGCDCSGLVLPRFASSVSDFVES